MHTKFLIVNYALLQYIQREFNILVARISYALIKSGSEVHRWLATISTDH